MIRENFERVKKIIDKISELEGILKIIDNLNPDSSKSYFAIVTNGTNHIVLQEQYIDRQYILKKYKEGIRSDIKFLESELSKL